MLRLAEYLVEDGHEVSVLVPKFLEEHIKVESVEVITFQVHFQLLFYSPKDKSTANDINVFYLIWGLLLF